MEDLRAADAPFDGRWWLPDDPTTAVGGRLEFDGGAWRLVLFGWLGPWDQQGAAGPVPDRLVGQIGTTPVTLLDLGIQQVNWGLQNPPHLATFAVRAVIVGAEVDGATLYTQASVELLNLNEFANRRPWTSENESQPVHWKVKEVYTDPGVAEAVVPGAKITLFRTLSHSNSDLSEARMTSSERVQFVFDTPLDLAAIEHDYVRPLKYLVELASARPTGVSELSVAPVGAGEYSAGCDVLSAFESNASTDPKAWFRFLFRLDSVSFDEVVPKWWALHAQIGRVSDLVAGLWEPNPNISNRFLDAASAIEGYHRHKNPGPGRTIFADRVDAVVAQAGPRFAGIVGDPVKWRDWVKDGRNSVAHQDPTMVDLEKEWRTTVGVAASMQWLLILVLLEELDVPDAVLSEGLRQDRTLDSVEQYLRSVKSDWFT